MIVMIGIQKECQWQLSFERGESHTECSDTSQFAIVFHQLYSTSCVQENPAYITEGWMATGYMGNRVHSLGTRDGTLPYDTTVRQDQRYGTGGSLGD